MVGCTDILHWTPTCIILGEAQSLATRFVSQLTETVMLVMLTLFLSKPRRTIFSHKFRRKTDDK